MSNKGWRYAAVLLGFGVAAAGGYLLGRYEVSPTNASRPALPTDTEQVAGSGQPAGAGAAAPQNFAAAGSFVHFQVANSNIKALLVDGPVIWLGTSSGLIKYQSDIARHTRYDNRSGLLSNGIFYLGKFGHEIWVGTYGGGLSILNTETQRWRNYNIPNGMGDAFVYDVLRTRSGDIWIATWSGANHIVGGKLDDIGNWELYTVENTAAGLPNDWVYGLAEGKSGEIWMATEGGLARFAKGQWSHWNHADGLGASYETVAADIQFQNDPGQYSAHHARQKKEQGLSDITVAYNPNYIISLVVDDDGGVWAGTWGAGLSHFDGSTWRTFTKNDGLPGNHIFALKKDASGTLWIGTSSGLAKYDGESFAVFGTMDGLYSDTVFAIDVAPDGNAWVGGFGGVAWFPQGLVKHAARP